MFELIYMSAASPAMTSAKARDIAEQSQMNNALADISGVLVFDGINFAQILEGDEPAVRRLLAIIAADDRHSDLTVLAEGATSGRSFAGWTMAYNDNSSMKQLLDRVADINSARSQTNDHDLKLALARLKSDVLGKLARKINFGRRNLFATATFKQLKCCKAVFAWTKSEKLLTTTPNPMARKRWRL